MQHNHSSAVAFNSIYCNPVPLIEHIPFSVFISCYPYKIPKYISRLSKTVTCPKIAICSMSSPRLFELQSESHNAPPRFP